MSIILDGSTGITTPNIVSPTQTISTKLDLTGGQIKFPATQVPSTDANTLDDYEEGTFTCTLTALTPPTTPPTTTGIYTKIGKIVTVHAKFSNVNTSGASSGLRITGLPFQSNSLGAMGQFGRIGLGTGKDVLLLYNNNTTAGLNTSDDLNDVAIVAGTGKYFWFTITYVTD